MKLTNTPHLGSTPGPRRAAATSPVLFQNMALGPQGASSYRSIGFVSKPKTLLRNVFPRATLAPCPRRPAIAAPNSPFNVTKCIPRGMLAPCPRRPAIAAPNSPFNVTCQLCPHDHIGFSPQFGLQAGNSVPWHDNSMAIPGSPPRPTSSCGNFSQDLNSSVEAVTQAEAHLHLIALSISRRVRISPQSPPTAQGHSPHPTHVTPSQTWPSRNPCLTARTVGRSGGRNAAMRASLPAPWRGLWPMPG